MAYTATVLGASGYTGAEVLRVLAGHPSLSAVGIARSGGADELAAVHPHLAGSDAVFADPREVAGLEADVCFSCLPSGVLEPDDVAAKVVVDLSDDHRWSRGWVYGLTEFARSSIAGASAIANPGCYPTATLLCLVPFIRAGLVDGPVIVDAISGVSGAGRKAADRLLAANIDGGVEAYGSTEHRHVGEIETGLSQLGGTGIPISFTPHLAPMARGLLVTARARMRSVISDEEALDVLKSAYSGEPFVHVTPTWPNTKALRGSNGAHVSARVDARNGWLICSAAIDNLGKGAAGQAVQNANLALDLEESAGLSAIGVWP
jgi:N-acetyl-gamma-glutamyl-phosphate reductase